MCLLAAGIGGGGMAGTWELADVVGWTIGGRTDTPSPGRLDIGGRFARRALALVWCVSK